MGCESNENAKSQSKWQNVVGLREKMDERNGLDRADGSWFGPGTGSTEDLGKTSGIQWGILNSVLIEEAYK